MNANTIQKPRARYPSNCHYCGERIRQGMPIERVGFEHDGKAVYEFVHAALCANDARVEWPELNALARTGNGADRYGAPRAE